MPVARHTLAALLFTFAFSLTAAQAADSPKSAERAKQKQQGPGAKVSKKAKVAAE